MELLMFLGIIISCKKVKMNNDIIDEEKYLNEKIGDNDLNEKPIKSMVVEKTTLSEITHKIRLELTPYLERIEERMRTLEIFLTTKDPIEKEQIQIMLEEQINEFKEKINMKPENENNNTRIL